MSDRGTPRNERLPVTLLTGFLGSGKTTVLRHLLADPALARSAVFINEFGDVAIDDQLVRAKEGELVALPSGCLCCSLRGGLVFALTDLDRRRHAEEIGAIDQVLIETTGLADPAPILLSLATDPTISERYRLASVLVTVDALNGWRQLDRQPEAVRQLVAAEHVLLTKTDVADPSEIERLSDRIAAINPQAAMHRVQHGVVAPHIILRESDAGVPTPDTVSQPTLDHRHDTEIESFTLELRGRPTRRSFEAWLETLLAHRADDVLRIKGIVQFAHEDRPVLVNGLGGCLHPFENMDDRFRSDTLGRLVFITRRLPAAIIRDSLAGITGEQAA